MNNRYLGIALLAVGVLLLAWGISASDSFASDMSQFFKGRPTRETMWLVGGGALLAVVGIGLALRGKRA